MDVVVSPVRLVFNVDMISAVAVASNWLYLTGGPSSVVRINLDEPSSVVDIPIPRKLAEAAGPIKQLYADPAGQHVLAVTTRNEHFIYARSQPKAEFRPLNKLRGLSTLCAAFHPTKPAVLLLGTRGGTIIEVVVDSSANEAYFKRELRSMTTVWKSLEREPVTSLLARRERPGVSVYATTARSLLCWEHRSRRSMDRAEERGEDRADEKPERGSERNGERSSADRCAEPPSPSSPSSSPSPRTTPHAAFGVFDVTPSTLLTGERLGRLAESPNREVLALTLGPRRVAVQVRGAGWSELSTAGDITALAVSDYYALAITGGTKSNGSSGGGGGSDSSAAPVVVATNVFDVAIQREFPLPASLASRVSAAITDAAAHTFWLYSNDALMELRIEDELAGMWRALARQKRFEAALGVAPTRAEKSRVLELHARHELAQRHFVAAARLFGLSDVALETVALDLMRLEKTGALSDRDKAGITAGADIAGEVVDDTGEAEAVVLRELLRARLQHTRSRAQQTMLTSWLAELGDLAFLDARGSSAPAWDVGVVAQILRQRGRTAELVPLLVNSGRIADAVATLVRQEQWAAALELLRQREDRASVYRHAAVLLHHEPQRTVESWMRISGLDTAQLVPHLLAYAQQYRGPPEENQARRYLAWVAKNELNITVFNAMVVILAEANSGRLIRSSGSGSSSSGSASSAKDSTKDSATGSIRSNSKGKGGASTEDLLTFLRNSDKTRRIEDYDFALRVCLQHRQTEAAVYLYTRMELYEDAVQLCLAAGSEQLLETAIGIADQQAGENEELRKHLLKEIAATAIATAGPKAAIRFARLLRVDDLVAQFPDFETLNELAPEIVKSLEHTNAKLGALDLEISESLAASESMQRELEEFRRRPVLVEPGEACQLCDFPLVTRKFVVFPCQHGFHADCVARRQPPGRPVTEECVLCAVANLKQIDQPLGSVF